MTVQEVYDLYLRYKKNLGDVSTELFLDWADEVNRFAYRIMYGTDPNRFIASSTVNVVTNTTSYALPTDFENMSPFGCGLYLVSGGIQTDRALPNTGIGSLNSGYYLQAGNIIITPNPQADNTYTLRYIPKLSALDDFSDTMCIPDEYIYYVRDAIDCKYDSWDEDPGAEGLADQRFVRSLDELARNIRKDNAVMGINTNFSVFT